MPSAARIAFDANCKDIERLLDLSSDTPGTRPHLDVLNKAGIVLLTSFWEAYCEDLAAEALAHIVDNASDASTLPLDLQKIVARELRKDAHELAIWQLADGGWRQVLRARLADLQQDRNRRLNTPKTRPIDELFLNAVGIDKISKSWHSKAITSEEASRKLDEYVTLRGEVAHRGRASDRVLKSDVANYYDHVKFLVSKTGGQANRIAREATGIPLWPR